MKLKLNLTFAKGEFDTKNTVLVDIPARGIKREYAPSICIKDGMNFTITDIDLGDLESSNAFAKELVRRWNEFPQEQKQ